jgi:hypothetical protein
MVTGRPDQFRTGIAENRLHCMTLQYHRWPSTRVAELVLTRSRYFFFFLNPSLFAICIKYNNTISKWRGLWTVTGEKRAQ